MRNNWYNKNLVKNKGISRDLRFGQYVYTINYMKQNMHGRNILRRGNRIAIVKPSVCALLCKLAAIVYVTNVIHRLYLII